MEKPLTIKGRTVGVAGVALLLAMSVAAKAEIAVSANDGKQYAAR